MPKNYSIKKIDSTSAPKTSGTTVHIRISAPNNYWNKLSIKLKESLSSPQYELRENRIDYLIDNEPNPNPFITNVQSKPERLMSTNEWNQLALKSKPANI